MECISLIRGAWLIGAIRREGKRLSWFEEFLKELGANYDVERDRLLAMLDETSKNGTEGLPTERFGFLGNGLFEFKTRSLRVFFFKDEGKVVLLCNGYVKKSQKANKLELERAHKMKKAYSDAKKAKTLVWKECDDEKL
jgi:hypothetical protein